MEGNTAWKAGDRCVWPLAGALLGFALLAASVEHGMTRGSVLSLLGTTQTIIGQRIAYPTEAPAKVTAVIVTMQPGEETGWHQHDVPMFGYILEGEVTVDYGAKGTRVYRQGRALIEAIDWAAQRTQLRLGRSAHPCRCSWAPRACPIPRCCPSPPPQ